MVKKKRFFVLALLVVLVSVSASPNLETTLIAKGLDIPARLQNAEVRRFLESQDSAILRKMWDICDPGGKTPTVYDLITQDWTEDERQAFWADVDGSGEVDIVDARWVCNLYGRRVGLDEEDAALRRADVVPNGQIGEEDLRAVLDALGKRSPVRWQDADPNGNGAVSLKDFSFLQGWIGIPLAGNPKGFSCTVNYLDRAGEMEVDIFDVVIFTSFLGLPLESLPSGSLIFDQVPPKIMPPKS